MEPLTTVEHRGYKIEVYSDDFMDNPREWDNMGILAYCSRNTYRLDYSEDACEPFLYLDSMREWIESNKKFMVYWPVRYSSSQGIAICSEEKANGFIYCTLETVKKEGVTPEIAENNLRIEIETYNRYLNGEVEGYKIITLEGSELDSCWGFDDRDYMIEECKEIIDLRIESLEEAERFHGLTFAL